VKRITTRSGATYEVDEDHTVRRTSYVKDMAYTRDGFQFTDGFLAFGIEPDDIEVGAPFMWQGVVNDYTELIRTSFVESIEEVLE